MGERADAVRFVGICGRQPDERGHTLGLGRPVDGGDRGPERRLRRDLAAERGEDVGGVGHVRLPKAGPTPRAGPRWSADLILGKGVLPMLSNEVVGVPTHGLAFWTVLFALSPADHHIAGGVRNT